MEKSKSTFLRQLGLSPTPDALRPPRLEGVPGRPSNSEFWGVCGELHFNSSKPDCVGHVVTYQRKSAKGRRPAFRCTRCRKQLSQLNGSDVLHGLPGQGSFFAFRDRLGRPNVKLSRREIIWLAYSLTKEMSVSMTEELVSGEFKMSKQVRADWRNLLREVIQGELSARPAMGGPNQIDEGEQGPTIDRRRRGGGQRALGLRPHLGRDQGAAALQSRHARRRHTWQDNRG